MLFRSAILISVIIAGTFIFNSVSSVQNIVLTEFEEMWETNQVKSVVFNQNKSTLTGTLQDDSKFTVSISESSFESLRATFPEIKTIVEIIPLKTKGIMGTILPTLLMLVVIGALFFFFTTPIEFIQNPTNTAKGYTDNKAKLENPQNLNTETETQEEDVENRDKVTFKDVAGAEEEKIELEEIVDFLKEPEKYQKMGARIPKGVLLVGPPGTGKTLLAKAVAGEANAPFYSISGSDFVEMFVGVGASRVRSLFEAAKQNSPSLIFIDEIDAVGRQRGAGLGGGHDEREQTLNQLLVEMDGFKSNDFIIVIAATNRPDILDPALLRPGRFDRQVTINNPDKKGREEILLIHTKNKPLSENINLETIAQTTAGFSGADLENLANEAALLAVRKGKEIIEQSEFDEAIVRVMLGPEKKNKQISQEDKKLTAYHEAGHAVVAKSLKHCDPVHKISIISRGMAGGYTMHLPTEETSYTSKSKHPHAFICKSSKWHKRQ